MFYIDLFRALQQHDVDYLLVGGLAMNLHGVPRMTMDVDLVLHMTEDNLDGFIQAVSELGLKPGLPVAIKDLCDEEKRRIWIEKRHLIAFSLVADAGWKPTLDIVLEHNLDMELALQRRVSKMLGNTWVQVAAIADMIRMKRLAGRAQDLADIQQLQRIANGGQS